MNRTRRAATLASLTVAALIVFAEPTAAQSADQSSIVVVDGDTLIVDGETIRIQGVDTPEAGERCHDRATQTLRRLVARGYVRITRRDGTDRYGRTVASVSAGGRDVGLELIRAGVARPAYDSAEGYGAHPRESSYRNAQRSTPCTSQSAPFEPEQGQADPPFWTWAALTAVAADSGFRSVDVDSFVDAHGDTNRARIALAEKIWYTVAERNARPAPAPTSPPAAPSRTSSDNGGARLPGGGCPPGGCTVPDGPRQSNNNPYDDGGPRRADGSCPPGGCT